MHFFKHKASSQNRSNDTKEDLEQAVSSQTPAPLSPTTQNFPGMAKPLTRPLFREPGASVSSLETGEEHSNAKPRPRGQGKAVHKKKKRKKTPWIRLRKLSMISQAVVIPCWSVRTNC
ncbi:unnamed protein product [Phytomonas sp. Hart1]|nr:unnamed protein product [Phytomonas sp. Hart1]|eukprot:CCW67960.1 unnamed protein product [Phytomonas sp. isolate Hart1]